MNTSPPDPRAPSERDWLAQERALSDGGDRRDALLARALRTPPASTPPPGFAAAVARAAAMSATRIAPDARLEQRLLHGLLALMGLAGAGALALYGPQWWGLAREAMGADGAQWGLVAGVCLLLSWLPGAARWVAPERNPAATG